LVEELLGRSLLDDHTVFHEDNPVGNFAGKAHFVRDHQHGHTLFGQLLHDGEHFADQLGVEGGGGLVK
jgi:hypothetical protein